MTLGNLLGAALDELVEHADTLRLELNLLLVPRRLGRRRRRRLGRRRQLGLSTHPLLFLPRQPLRLGTLGFGLRLRLGLPLPLVAQLLVAPPEPPLPPCVDGRAQGARIPQPRLDTSRPRLKAVRPRLVARASERGFGPRELLCLAVAQPLPVVKRDRMRLPAPEGDGAPRGVRARALLGGG